jgi:hypothetical protein
MVRSDGKRQKRSPEARARRKEQKREMRRNGRRRSTAVGRASKGKAITTIQKPFFSTQHWGPQLAGRRKMREFQLGGAVKLKGVLGGKTSCFRWSNATEGGGQQYDFFTPLRQAKPTATTEGDYGVFKSLAAFKKAWEPLGYDGFFDPQFYKDEESGRLDFVDFIEGWAEKKDAKAVFWFRVYRVPQLAGASRS